MRLPNLQDPIWGNVTFSDEEWRVINVPSFQRLRRIHQLALTHLVFPGTTHTRFEHSLGTSHAAALIADRLLRDEAPEVPFTQDDVRLVRLAALLHDIGHGPFSHVADKFLGKTGHERIGALLIESNREIVGILGAETCRRIAALLTGEEKRRTVQRDIVSGPSDADKVDYLRRDSYYAGVEQGRFDHHRFIDQVRAISSRPDTQLGVRWGGMWAVEGMILARHHMHRTVYGHRNRLITDFLLQRGIAYALQEELLPTDLFTVPAPDADVEAYLDQYLRWDDWRVTVSVGDSDGRAAKVFARLRDRQLLKLLVYLEDEALGDKLGFPAKHRLALGIPPEAEERIEQGVAEMLKVGVEDVIVRLEQPKQPLVIPGDPALLEQDIVVVDMHNEKQTLYQRSEIFSAQQPKETRVRLYVYAPIGRKHSVAEAAESLALDMLRQELTGGE